MKTLPLLSNGIPAFLFIFLSFEDFGEWEENLSRWAALSTTQNFKFLWCYVQFLSSQLPWKLTVRKAHGAQHGQYGAILGLRQTPPHLSQWLMCNITSECEYEHFNMKRIDFCHRHGILMIGNNILIFFFLIKAIFPLIMEGLALCEIYIHSPCMMSAITTPNG